MASEMRVACVLCARHPCVRGGGLRRLLPCVHSAVESPLSILLATSDLASDRTCVSVVGGVARGTAWKPHGEEPSGWVSRGSCAA